MHHFAKNRREPVTMRTAARAAGPGVERILPLRHAPCNQSGGLLSGALREGVESAGSAMTSWSRAIDGRTSRA